jgi:hypothetical protein
MFLGSSGYLGRLREQWLFKAVEAVLWVLLTLVVGWTGLSGFQFIAFESGIQYPALSAYIYALVIAIGYVAVTSLWFTLSRRLRNVPREVLTRIQGFLAFDSHDSESHANVG